MLNSGKEIIVANKITGEKIILLGFVTEENEDFYIGVHKNGDIRIGNIECIKVLLSDEQKAMLN